MKQNELESIQKMWNIEKLTSGEIANRIGRTRNAVMGIINRARGAGWLFDQRDSFVPIKPSIPKPPQPTVKAPRVIKSRPKVPPKPVPVEITILELEPHHCKAIIGRSKRVDLPTYCGKPRLDGSSYCEACSSVYGYRRTA